jgi:bacteriocin biosynthesis cyclodehydratase domain-containing protein
VATASRLTSTRMAVAGIGGFGLDVAQAVAKSWGAMLLTLDALEGALADGVVGVAAMWRPCPKLCERLDGLSFEAGTPWLPIVMDHPRIRVGPWGAAPEGPCYQCYAARKSQHDLQPKVTRALEAAYDCDATDGPTGYLPHHVTTAVGLAKLSLRKQTAEGVAAATGEALVVNVVTGKSAAHIVIPCHGCTRCGTGDRLGSDPPLRQAVASLAARIDDQSRQREGMRVPVLAEDWR